MIASVPQAWEPGAYLKFEDLRLRPALDLLAQVSLDAPDEITDLGCGPGGVTPYLRHRWPDARITALDSSKAMLTRAKAEHLGLGVTWQLADVRTWAASQPQDLIYSNAVLHWMDDHEALFPRVMGELRPGGTLAVQMPNQFNEPSHVLMREVAQSGPWAEALQPVLRAAPVADMAAYYDWLQPHSAQLNIWESTYAQVLEGEAPVLDWISSTALKPLMEALDAETAQAYRTELGKQLRTAYPRCGNGQTVFAFRRLFIVAKSRD